MKRKCRNALAILLCAMLLIVPACGVASSVETAVLYLSGNVADDASVLSDQTVADIATLNERSSVMFTVATRHFLGGQEVQSYCDNLFSAWNLGPYDMLLLLVVGEERYAVTLGSGVTEYYISTEQVNSLLSSKLRQPFLQERDYDGAVGSFLLSVASQAARASGETISTGGLFGTESQANNHTEVAPYDDFADWGGNWWQGFFAGNSAESIDQYSNYDADYDESDYNSSPGFGRLIFLAVVLLIIVNNRRKKGKSGLGLFGWIVASKGIKEFSRTMHGGNRPVRPPRPPRPRR